MNLKSYLDNMLKAKELELNELNTQHRINVAVHEAKYESITKDIMLIEKQLSLIEAKGE